MNLSDKYINGDCMDYLPDYPDNYFDLAIVDPPYNIKIDDWDNIKDYEIFIDNLVMQLDRVLKRTATMYFWGSSEWIATCKTIIDKYDFALKSWLIWDKGAKQQNATRSFADVTEHCLHFVKPKNQKHNPIKEYLNNARINKGMTLNDINKALGFATNGGGVASSYLGNKDTVVIPSENHYNLLRDLLELDKSYSEFKDIVYTFNIDKIRLARNPKDKRVYKNEKQIPTNVFYNQNGNESGKHSHPTVKPLDIIRNFVLASSNKNDTIISPFVGSGTDIIACILEGRDFIGFEIDKDYYQESYQRVIIETSQTQLTDFCK